MKKFYKTALRVPPVRLRRGFRVGAEVGRHGWMGQRRKRHMAVCH